MKFKKQLATIGISLLCTVAAFAKTELEVTSWKGGTAEPANFPLIIEMFEKEYPDIKVEFNFISRGDTTTTIPSRLQAGTPPDVIMVDGELMNVWAQEGQLMDLSDEPWVEKMEPRLINHMSRGGKVYYMMTQISGMGIYTNDDLLAKAGITEVPKNIPDLIKACEKLNDKGIMPMLFPANNGGWTPYLYIFALGLADASIPDQNRVYDFDTGAITYEGDEAFKNAFLSLRQLIEAKCFDPKISAGIDPWTVGLATFQSGRVAMLPQGLWNIPVFERDELPENFSVHPFPTPKGDTGVIVDYYGPGWAIPKDSKHQEAAKKWIEFWSRDDVLKLMLQADSGLTTLTGGTSGLSDKASEYVKARDNGHHVLFPLGVWHPRLTQVMNDDITSFMLDSSQDIDAILKSWDQVRAKNAQ